MPTELDYAWAAGLIDGEGCIFISRQHRGGSVKTINYRLGVKVAMCHEATILKLRQMFGFGSKHRCEHKGKSASTAYIWLAQANCARDVLEKIRPYAFTKRAEILVAMEFLSLPKWYGGRFRGQKSPEYLAREYELWDRLRRLKSSTRLKLDRLGQNRKTSSSFDMHIAGGSRTQGS